MEALLIVILVPILLFLIFVAFGLLIWLLSSMVLFGSTFAPVIIGIPLGMSVSDAGNVGLGVLLIVGSIVAMPFWFSWLSKQSWYRLLAEAVFSSIAQ